MGTDWDAHAYQPEHAAPARHRLLRALLARKGGMLLNGVDVSVWNGVPADWRTEAGSFAWAAVKFTELNSSGPYRNPTAKADWDWLHDHGKGRVAYLFGHPSESASATVSLFTSTCHDLGLRDGDGVALDLEETDGRSAAQVASWAQDVTGLLARDLDRSPLLYSFLAFIEAGNCAGLGHLPLWIADPSSTAGKPRIPHPWTSYAIHQWTWKPLDRDVARYSNLAAMQTALGRKERYTVWKSDGKTSLTKAAGEHHATAAKVLHDTAAAGKAWPKEIHDWLNKVLADEIPPKGCDFRMPPK